MKVNFRTIKPYDHEVVNNMMFSLYSDDPGGKSMTVTKASKTLDKLSKHPELGTIIVFSLDENIIGYAILINFWSNEYGGNMLHIDELFVARGYRSQGVATLFINYLMNTDSYDTVGLRLEVSHENTKAIRLYSQLGFTTHKHMAYQLEINDTIGNT